MLKFNYQNALTKEELCKLKEATLKAYDTLINKKGAGSDFLGWLEYPKNHDMTEYNRIKECAKRIQAESDCLVVVGIGGSYLGAKAVIEALRPYFKGPKDLEIIFAGNTLSSTYMVELLDYLKDKDFSVNVISKSGTTTEPAIAFRLLKELLEQKYGEAASKRIYATTDKAKGALKVQASELGYESFIVPDDIGGRYSWFTGVPRAAPRAFAHPFRRAVGALRADINGFQSFHFHLRGRTAALSFLIIPSTSRFRKCRRADFRRRRKDHR